MALEPRQKGITLDRLEQDFGIRKGRIANTLKKYKSLVTMLIKKDPYKTFYSLITQDCKYRPSERDVIASENFSGIFSF